MTTLQDADEARGLLSDLNVRYYGHQIVADRMWELRENLMAYDASFVALTEALDSELITTDARLAEAPGHDARIVTIQ